MKKIKLYGSIQKAEKQKDGTLIVRGIASTEAQDTAGETVKAAAMRAAIPDYMRFGSVREMHQPIAAGVALKCEVNADGQTVIEAKIVDPVTIRKVEEGVLQGFSIGGRVTGRDKLDRTIITGLRLSEVSLVDRPCNPEALVNLCKVEDDEKDKDKDEDAEDKKATKEDDSGDKESEGESAKDDDGKKDDDKKDDDDDDDDDTEKLEKLSKSHDEALSKILSLQTTIKKLQSELDTFRKKPAPAKGVLRTVSKGEDVINPDTETNLQKQAEVFASLKPMDQAQTLVKLIHGGR